MANTTRYILLFGAGKSATVLIRYLLSQSVFYHWRLTVVDADLLLAQSKINRHVNGTALSFNISDAGERAKAIRDADIVISMLPPALHYLVAQDCVSYGKHLLTASYLDEPMRKLEREIDRKGLLFLCEMGLDPGIDHMSAMQLIQQIKDGGGIIKSFKSHCGGLIAPESDDNPWHYKITWNPANVVNAGKTGAVYKYRGAVMEKGYKEIFKNNQEVDIAGLGAYAYYPNRDSLTYAALYGLESAHTFMRTTLRHPDFCRGWQYIIEAGLTGDMAAIKPGAFSSVAGWFNHCVEQQHQVTSFADYINDIVAETDRGLLKKQLEFLQLNSMQPVPSKATSSADILRYQLESTLKMQQEDRDMIIMVHEIDYEKNNRLYSTKSCMIVKGDDALNTAMAKTVGLPLGIATELILEKKINLTGLKIPVTRDIYEPVLIKLKEKEIKFEEL